ncbi:hypothetical protein KYE026_40390 [Escherichia coli]
MNIGIRPICLVFNCPTFWGQYNLRLAFERSNSDVSLFFAGRQDMLTKYALVAIIVLCCTVLGFTLMVGDSLCELSIRERGMEFKAVLAYESKK